MGVRLQAIIFVVCCMVRVVFVRKIEESPDFVLAEREADRPYSFAIKRGNFQTFTIPGEVSEPATASDIDLGRELVRAFRTDGLLQIAIDDDQAALCKYALSTSKNFFLKTPLADKRKLVNDMTFSGYIGSGEELTDGKADGSEIFTITPDIALNDSRVINHWPCHGPVPWPTDVYKDMMTDYMAEIGRIGDTLLKLIALGVGVDVNTFYDYAHNGWHHMRVLRFPSKKNAAANITRGIGAHTDYGMLVIASQDDVGGLWIRPPIQGEKRLNAWIDGNSMAGMYEHDFNWTFVEPVPNTLTVFPGDMFQLMTKGYLLSTPHKVALDQNRERYAIAYFHEPAFDRKLETLEKFDAEGIKHSIEYGTHFSNMFIRGLPERSVSKRMKRINYKRVLNNIFGH